MAATIATGLLVASQLLLLVCTATATATARTTLPGFPAVVIGAVPPAVPATDVVGGAGALPKLPIPFPFPGGIPQLPFPLPGGNNHAAGAECLNAVQQAESCVGDVLRSLASSSPVEDAVRAGSKACCVALQVVGDRCFRGVPPVSPFRALFAPLVKQACGGGGLLPGDLGRLVPGPRA